MATLPVAQVRKQWDVQAIVWTTSIYLVLGAVALVPRVLDLGHFITGDETSFWLKRSELWLNAIQSRNFGATAITDHPGVTTMWLGSMGILLRKALAVRGLLPDESIQTILTLMRLPGALVHSAAVLIGYALLQRLVSRRIALLGVFLWAVDPFVIAYSRVLHVDALAGTFLTLSLIAACVYWFDRPVRWVLLLSGAAGALAVLSKSPALVVVPAVGLVALLAPRPRLTKREYVVALFKPLLAWAAIACITAIVFWPVLWANPRAAYDQVALGVYGEGAQPHQLGNFFLGREDPAPGFAFYPVSLVLRLTPWGLAGLVLLPIGWRVVREDGKTYKTIAAFAGFVVLFTLAMSVFPKKFNRYLVPVFPIVDILAAAGLVWGGTWLGGWLRRRALLTLPQARALGGVGVSVVAIAAILNLAFWHPYYIIASNQAFGDATVSATAFLQGWGEGLEQAADWLNQQPDITSVLTASTALYELQAYLKDGAQATGPVDAQFPPQTRYVVIYNRHVQINQLEPPFDQFYGHAQPIHVVRIHGIDYAWIYKAPPPVASVLPASFGPDIKLHGLTVPQTVRPGEPLTVSLVWEPQAQAPANTMMFFHLLGPDGERYAQADLPYPFPGWQPNEYTTLSIPLPVAANAPAGTYQLALGLYSLDTGQRLPLSTTASIIQGLDGPDSLPLSTIEIQ